MRRVCSYVSDPDWSSQPCNRELSSSLVTWCLPRFCILHWDLCCYHHPRCQVRPHVLLPPMKPGSTGSGGVTTPSEDRRLHVPGTPAQPACTVYSVLQAHLKLLMKGWGKRHHQSPGARKQPGTGPCLAVPVPTCGQALNLFLFCFVASKCRANSLQRKQVSSAGCKQKMHVVIP